ncbi:ceramide-1-phosphate transfer protein [Ahaetulla prasina]|uniref:ceramide-1-phosphate transfer protein n=1 Tax=Ahaetulla prasina TaxID=499056 RepID=UPI00264A1B2A|nr:ceramide-1-phosphate transfer protein [Ahaetulla prasina]XP_058017452.1 ceramide-1-phosphate transfer protein [Ahaetulla prasina]XP_058017453.1 ceramide-1-phosphate transfer protein [Ahaetulla prasina]
MADREDVHGLKDVLVMFQSCLNGKEEILMDPYLGGWKGLVRFLNTMGPIFSFISKDAVTKIQIMENFRSSEQQEDYVTFQAMVKYELANGLVDLRELGSYPASGCRTILRLHRALRWLHLFLEGLRTSGPSSKTSTLCTDSYNASLANYHPWIVRKAATMAFYALPTRDAFLENMRVGTTEEAIEMLGEALPYISSVYEITENLYAEHKLLDLP